MEPQDQINTDQPEIVEPTVAETVADQPVEPSTEKPMENIGRISVKYRMRATGEGTFEYVMQIDPSLWEQFRNIITKGCEAVVSQTAEVGFEFMGWIGEEPPAKEAPAAEENPVG